MDVNKRIKTLRKDYLNLTQEQFSDAISISRANLGSIEVGRINVTDRVIQDVCREFNVNEEWLRSGIGNPIIEMSRDDELAAWTGAVLNPNNNNEFMKKFVHMLSKLKEEDWKVLEKMALLMAEENKES
ncbi:helix-turn-helix domain-containing protein [Anaerocolumna chitinilytica]|uniref:HTH cro/C1-type domain-containing protein n=1 Tax=Anaerocolumna chitinilytica TaxID=1727145 RepID=A0A7I8DHV1_9FIRM|nr:helix-turn-helix transcriptional regulator [Anaerocolumna chitinilytica]BCJ98078.1 hypothetical protein bsdcttw_11190 [Anaerocolumna chitinilytica]